MSAQRFMLVSLIGEVWHTQKPGEALLLELFGTDTLPTPYRADTPAAEVVGALAALNPDYDVMLVGSEP